MEALIAKARRCKRPKDQKETAFGLADLSTHRETLEKLARKGGVESLVILLMNSKDMDCQRLCALALSNLSSDPFNCDIVARDDLMATLVPLIGDDGADLVTRQYACTCVGNVAAEPEKHRGLMRKEFRVIENLMALFRTEDVESGRVAAFALSNFAANALHREEIVGAGAPAACVALLTCEDVDAQLAALRALMNVCITKENRGLVVGLGVCDPLVVISRNQNIAVMREAAAAINCLSCWDANTHEICDRCVNTLVAMLLSGDTIVERQAVCAVANLSEDMELHERLIAERSLPPLISLALSTDLVSKGQAIRALALLSVNLEVQRTLLAGE